MIKISVLVVIYTLVYSVLRVGRCTGSEQIRYNDISVPRNCGISLLWGRRERMEDRVGAFELDIGGAGLRWISNYKESHLSWPVKLPADLSI